MKISRAIKILQEALISAGDVQIAFCLNTDADDEVGFFLPDCMTVVGGEGEPDIAAFMLKELYDVLLDQHEITPLPAMIRVMGPSGGEVH